MFKMTFIPYPKLIEFLKIFLKKFNLYNKILTNWNIGNDKYHLFSKSAWSIAVIAEWKKSISNKNAINIFIPDYFCNSSLVELRDIQGVNIYFYPINDKLLPDILLFDNLYKNINIDIFLFVHYFGQCSIISEEFFDLFKVNETCIIEDAAHVLLPFDTIGEVGDFVLYSPHKHLPMFDGAILVFKNKNNNKEHDIILENTIKLFNNKYNPNNIFLIFIWLTKRFLQSIGIKYIINKNAFEDKIINKKITIGPSISWLSKFFFNYYIDNITAILKIRKQNFETWSLFFNSSERNLITSSSNYLYSFNNFSNFLPENYFKKLQNFKLPITTWPDLPNEVLDNDIIHKCAIKFRKNNLFFPIHQSINKLDISKQCFAFFNDYQFIEIDKKKWNEYCDCIHDENLLQTIEYGESKKKVDKVAPKMFLITNNTNVPLALLLILVKRIPIIGELARINRGPIFLMKFNDFDKLKILSNILIFCKYNKWPIVSIAPNLHYNINNSELIKSLNLYSYNNQPWQSTTLNLNICEDDILKNFDGKWRNSLNKSIKSGIYIQKEELSDKNIKYLLNWYINFQNSKNFNGISTDLIKELSHQNLTSNYDFDLFHAYPANSRDPIGMLVSIKFYKTTIYLLGFSNEEGKKFQVNSYLLWEAIKNAKEKGSNSFDIGGIDYNQKGGITHFKKGLNGIPYQLIGEFLYINFNFKF
jgi:lipid II:glycine glycyltransferase (peptidoglycan interpeptide bridge formation enzyme)